MAEMIRFTPMDPRPSRPFYNRFQEKKSRIHKRDQGRRVSWLNLPELPVFSTISSQLLSSALSQRDVHAVLGQD